MKKKKKLNKRQKKLVEAICDPNVNTLAEASRIAGYNNRQAGWNALQKDTVRMSLEEVQIALGQKGFDPEKIAKMLMAGMSAKAIVTASYEGEITDEKSYVDFKERREHLKIALQLMKILGNGHDDKRNGNHLHIHLGDTRSDEIVREINNQLSAFGIRKPVIPEGSHNADSERPEV